MTDFGFVTPQQQPGAQNVAPGQLTPQQVQQLGLHMPAGQTNSMDPRSIYLQQALAQMGKQPQGNAMGLDANLMATALDQYSQQKGQQQAAQSQQPAMTQGTGINPALAPGQIDPSAMAVSPQAAGADPSQGGGLRAMLAKLFAGGAGNADPSANGTW